MSLSSLKTFKGSLVLRESGFRYYIRVWPHFPANVKGSVLFLTDPMFPWVHVLLIMLPPLPGKSSVPSSRVKFILKSLVQRPPLSCWIPQTERTDLYHVHCVPTPLSGQKPRLVICVAPLPPTTLCYSALQMQAFQEMLLTLSSPNILVLLHWTF